MGEIWGCRHMVEARHGTQYACICNLYESHTPQHVKVVHVWINKVQINDEWKYACNMYVHTIIKNDPLAVYLYVATVIVHLYVITQVFIQMVFLVRGEHPPRNLKASQEM